VTSTDFFFLDAFLRTWMGFDGFGGFGGSIFILPMFFFAAKSPGAAVEGMAEVSETAG
jgi:hypothetical protein